MNTETQTRWGGGGSDDPEKKEDDWIVDGIPAKIVQAGMETMIDDVLTKSGKQENGLPY